ncbi:MAG TPA: hypothetical protein VHN98_11415 [Acidimicrobiales bacterium]|nr:hypothetical protein [Acidimicrobiales bacterium]
MLTDRARLTLRDARVSPCDGCAAYCCNRIRLHSFEVRTLHELDYAQYLLNFDDIELGIDAEGHWSAYLLARCRMLSPEGRCTVHGTPAQPVVCVTYSEYDCWYRRALPAPGLTAEHVRIDRRRLDAIVDAVRFDDERIIVEMPTGEALHSLLATLPLEPDAPRTEWPVAPAPSAPSTSAADQGTGSRTALAMLTDSPCDGCAAPCCSTVAFPLDVPTGVGGLDHIRYLLGFPGVEVAIADDAWSLVVHTRCRHLEGTRCGVYGRPERPLTCERYDERTCWFKPTFGPPAAGTPVRIDASRLHGLLDAIAVDALGAIVAMPTVDTLRKVLDAAGAS